MAVPETGGVYLTICCWEFVLRVERALDGAWVTESRWLDSALRVWSRCLCHSVLVHTFYPSHASSLQPCLFREFISMGSGNSLPPDFVPQEWLPKPFSIFHRLVLPLTWEKPFVQRETYPVTHSWQACRLTPRFLSGKAPFPSPPLVVVKSC